MRRFRRLTITSLLIILSPAKFLFADGWGTKTSIPKQLDGPGYAVVNNKIYAFAAWTGDFNGVEVYDVATDSWTTKASMPTARRFLGCAATNNKIYAIGGYILISPFYLSGVEVYDVATDSWTTKASMPTARRGMGTVELNGKIYAIGGWNDATLNGVEVYDVATDSWTTKASMPTARDFLACVVANGKIYAIGGYIDTPPYYFNGVEVYDVATDSWTTKASMPTARHSATSAVVNNKIYVIGGYGTGNVYLSTVEEYDPATDSWTTKASMPTARRSPACGEVYNKIYVIGGKNQYGLPTVVEDYGCKVSGYVYYSDEITPFPGARVKIVSISTETATTDSGGYYKLIAGPYNTWILSVSSANYSFYPASVTYLNLNSDQNQNFRRVAGNPNLSWTGEAGYLSDGVEPNVGSSSDTYTYRVKYTDTENDAPKSGYPRVRIKKSGVDVQLLPMNYVSGAYTTGAIYSTSTSLSPGEDYTYIFEAYDVWNASATQFISGSGPDGKAYIKGTVKFPNGTPMGTVKMTLQYGLESQTQYTNSSGTYLFSLLDAGLNYALTPSSYSYYLFNPSSQTYSSLSDNQIQDFYRVNRTTLTWTGEVEYESDGLEPHLATTPGVQFTYRIRYLDDDDDPPDINYPRLRILKSGTTVRDAVMNEVDSLDKTYLDGKLYFYQTTLPSGRDYNYYLIVKDTFNLTYQTLTLSGPIVSTSPPQLLWTGETGYENDGLNPEVGTLQTTFYFRILYRDTDNDPPKAGYPKVHIRKAGVPITGSPFTMSSTGGTNYINGVVYYYNISNLSPSLDYTYYFETYDEYDKSATTSELNAPDVNTLPQLSWTGEAGYENDGLNPEGGATYTTYYFRIKYTDQDNQEPKTGYPKVHILKDGSLFLSATMQYISGLYNTGAIYQTQIILSTPSMTYAYYFETYDILGGSATTISKDAPDVSGREPILFEPAFSPQVGTTTMTYTFTVKYFDPDGDLPASGYPKVSLKLDQTAVVIATMTYVSGAIYSCSTLIPTPGKNYVYVMEAKDLYGWQSNTIENNGPQVSGYKPGLEFTETYPQSVKPRENFTITIKYTDQDNDPPLSGYPRAVFFLDGVEILSKTMTYISGDPMDALYSYTTNLSTLSAGYSYYFETYDKFTFGGLVKTNPRSLTVASPPTPPMVTQDSVKDGETVTTSQIVLSWVASDPDSDDPLTYHLYLSDPVSPPKTAVSFKAAALLSATTVQMKLVYSGKQTSYRLYSVQPGVVYFWRVDAENSYGVLSQGSLYAFKTLSIPEDKVFNYPNPFNPNREKTNIVFSAAEDGTAGVKVYSEFAELLFEGTVPVRKGSNIYPYDGKDTNGETLKSGSYVLLIKVDGKLKKNIILVLKK